MPGTTAPAPALPDGDRTAPTEPEPVSAFVNASVLTVSLSDGRIVIAPLDWYPRLAYGTDEERAAVHLTWGGLHWHDLDVDISVRGLLDGRRSVETAESLAAWGALVDRRRAQLAAGEEPEPFAPHLPLPDWWDEDDEEE
ncbi:DUF2442 domain-containing protein [Rubrivirga sp.]|uniref:DUF2442 domain-containing protein n=1 Tax=Rubrivirga sp. TaxID=1885344 RepID=UPI003B524B90